MESFFHLMKTNVVHAFRFTSDGTLDQQLRSYVPYYKRVRHSGLDYRSPGDYET